MSWNAFAFELPSELGTLDCAPDGGAKEHASRPAVNRLVHVKDKRVEKTWVGMAFASKSLAG